MGRRRGGDNRQKFKFVYLLPLLFEEREKEQFFFRSTKKCRVNRIEECVIFYSNAPRTRSEFQTFSLFQLGRMLLRLQEKKKKKKSLKTVIKLKKKKKKKTKLQARTNSRDDAKHILHSGNGK